MGKYPDEENAGMGQGIASGVLMCLMKKERLRG